MTTAPEEVPGAVIYSAFRLQLSADATAGLKSKADFSSHTVSVRFSLSQTA